MNDHADRLCELGLMDATPARIKRRRLGDGPVPATVLRPQSVEELIDAVSEAAERGQPYTVVGGRSNVVGALDTGAELGLCTERLAGVSGFDSRSNLVTVLAGTNGGWLEEWLNDRNRTLGQFPQSLYISTVGGWMNTRASGSLSARHGGIEHALRGARIVSPQGELLSFGPRVRSGGGIDGLAAFVGSEGSLGIVAEVTLEVHRCLPERAASFLFADLDQIVEAQRELVQGGYPVALVRGYNETESHHLLGEDAAGQCLLMVTTIGPTTLVESQQAAIATRLDELGGTALPAEAGQRWYAERYNVATMMEDRNRAAGSAFDTIEVSVPWSSASACARDMESTLAGVVDRLHLHFSHVYETGACFYSLLWLTDPRGDRAVLDRLHSLWAHALDVVEGHRGTIGHHHGIGALRAERYQRSDDACVHRELKQVWDPENLLRSRLLAPPEERV